MACKQNLDLRMCFDIGSPHLGCWGQTTSRIQNKEVRANSSISAIWSPYYPFLEERAMLGVIYAAVVGAGAKSRLKSRIQKFTPHCVCRRNRWGRCGRGSMALARWRHRATTHTFSGDPGSTRTSLSLTCKSGSSAASETINQCQYISKSVNHTL